MSGKFIPLQIPPGVMAGPTKNIQSSNWAAANMVRWIEGELQPVGGQQQYQWTFAGNPATELASRVKAIHGWYDLGGTYHIAYLCEHNIYVDTGGTLIDITPSGGLPIVPPTPSQTGYGALLYGADTYGTARTPPATARDQARRSAGVRPDPRNSGSVLDIESLPNVWSIDNFGAVLLVMQSVNGILYEWDPDGPPGTLMTPVANAPHGRCFTVTAESFVMIFGTSQDSTSEGGFPWRFAWCDQQDYTDWTFGSVTTQTGYLDIQPASPIVTAISGRFGTLIWTAKKCYVSRYIGLPYVYNYVELADGTVPWSPASVVSTSSYMLWMSDQGMFAFDGTTISPVQCFVRPWITDDIDLTNVRQQATMVHMVDFSEAWWFYPQDGQPFNTRAVIYNYREGWWSQAQMPRSAGITSSYTAPPILADGTIVYQHELGNVYADADLPWAETMDLNLTMGPRLVTLKQILPDIGGDVTGLQYTIYWRNSRSTGAPEQQTNPIAIRPDGYVDTRVTGRDIRFRFESIGPMINPFTLGAHMVDISVRGDR
jgi:hypothetical protein